ncbi:uncharacterized protein LOC127463867 isoform X2 [Manacus candei]|uniref:uncharacterized protein LOC127463867 isoform X2 n=1 Tax=Manacus candei TaxID=415023 RepID=UPI0022263283|nr:uncharacterized protein LOC127463867 isoform X2 [Manacus candei]
MGECSPLQLETGARGVTRGHSWAQPWSRFSSKATQGGQGHLSQVVDDPKGGGMWVCWRAGRACRGVWPGWIHGHPQRGDTGRGWSVGREGKGAGKGLEQQEYLRELGGLSLEKRGIRRDLFPPHNPLTGGGNRGGGQALLPGNKGQEERERPPAVPGEAQMGQEEEFLPGKGGQALAGAAQGGLECPALEVSQEGLAVALCDKVGMGHRGIHGLGGLFQPQGFWDSVKALGCPGCDSPVGLGCSPQREQQLFHPSHTKPSLPSSADPMGSTLQHSFPGQESWLVPAAELSSRGGSWPPCSPT